MFVGAFELRGASNQKYALLASVVAILLGIGLFVGFGRQGNSATQSKGAWRPHFTIPILSPFTSIVSSFQQINYLLVQLTIVIRQVEHEMSKVGFRTTAVFLIISGIVVYALVRHRMGH